MPGEITPVGQVCMLSTLWTGTKDPQTLGASCAHPLSPPPPLLPHTLCNPLATKHKLRHPLLVLLLKELG